jgi:hypothetical protein
VPQDEAALVADQVVQVGFICRLVQDDVSGHMAVRHAHRGYRGQIGVVDYLNRVTGFLLGEADELSGGLA